MLRRNATVVAAGGVFLVGTYEFCKQLLMQTGKIESDLARVTMSKIGSDDPYYERSLLLERLMNYRRLFRILNSVRESNTAARLDNAIVDMQTDVSTGALRKQPYCIMLFGPPGVGKSSLAIQIARAIMIREYGHFTSHQMVTLNETDDFQSEFRTSHKVVLFDDIAASRADHSDTKNPWRKVIDFVNNVQKTALNPNCEMKGKVYIKPDLVILTSNIDFSEHWCYPLTTMNCPEAIQRRCKQTLKLHDYKSVSVMEYFKKSKGGHNTIGHSMYRVAGEPPRISRESAIAMLVEDYVAHMKDQSEFVEEFNNFFDDLRSPDVVLTSQSGYVRVPNLNYISDDESDFSDDDSLFDYFDDDSCISIPGLHAESHVDFDSWFLDHGRTDPHLDFQDTTGEMECPVVPLELQSIYGPPELMSHTHPKWATIRSFAIYIADALNSWDTIELLLTSDSRVLSKKIRSYEEHWGLSPPTREQLKRILFRVATSNFNNIELHPFTIYNALVADPIFGFPTTFIKKTRLKLLAFREKDINRTSNSVETPTPGSLLDPPDFPVNKTGSSGASTSSMSNEEILTREQELISQLTRILSADCTMCASDSNVHLSRYGEVDLVAHIDDCIVVAEVKVGSSQDRKARTQAIKYGGVFSLLQPETRVFGVTYSSKGLSVYYDNGRPFKSNALDNLFSVIGYAKFELE